MSKEVLKNKKADKILKIIEEVLDLNQLEQQKGERLNQIKYLVDYQLLQLNEKQEIIPKNVKRNQTMIVFFVQIKKTYKTTL